MKTAVLSLLAVLVTSIGSYSVALSGIGHQGKHSKDDGYLPKNDLHLQKSVVRSNVTEDQFNHVLAEVESKYSNVAMSHGLILQLNNQWHSDEVNAYAYQENNVLHVDLHGGLARRSELDQDSFELVVCHELGHHFAGYAGNYVEGQADYYSTHVCAREMWGSDISKNAKFRKKISSEIKQKCNEMYRITGEQNLCYRTLTAAQKLGDLLSVLGGRGKPKFSTPDLSEVSHTSSSHPEAQCRLDTLLAGAQCLQEFDLYRIPETFSDAITYSCTRKGGFTKGVRPKCWFKVPGENGDDDGIEDEGAF